MKSTITKIKISLVIFCFTLYALPFPLARAQGVSLGISPTIIQIDATPPASINTPITIENNGETPLELQIMLRSFTASPKENGHLLYYAQNDPRATPAIFQKIQISENEHPRDSIRLAPHQKKTLVMHIGIPKNESRDDYYFSVVFVTKNTNSPNEESETSEQEETNSQTPAGIATNVLLSIGPKGPTRGEIREFSTPFFREAGPVPFTLRIKNTSDHLITPRGEILIKNMFNQTIGRVNLLPVNILANTTRSLPDTLQSPEATLSAALTNYLLTTPSEHPVAVWPETFLLGPYTAQLTIALSEQGPVFRRQIYFFALPLSVLIGILASLIIIAYLIIRIRRRLKSAQ